MTRWDAIGNSVRELTGAGLLHHHGPFVFTTHASLRAQKLLSGRQFAPSVRSGRVFDDRIKVGRESSSIIEGRSMMAGELEAIAAEMVEALAALDLDWMVGFFGEEVASVDEISRQWLYGKTAVEGYLSGLVGAVSDVHTELRDPHERVWGDTGVLTCRMEQDYVLDGNAQHVSAPTTMVYRREDGEWKIVLFHSIPISEDT